MSQPTQPQQTPLMARRIGPFPVLVWFIVIVLALAAFLWWRKRKSGASDSSAGTYTGQNTASTGFYYPGDAWVTQSKPSNTNPPNPDSPVKFPGMPDRTRPIPTTDDPVPPFQPDTPPAVSTVTYPVRSGDTLWGIAQKYSIPGGSGALYAANSSLIESVAKQHGYSSSDSGHWIFPGTELVIPI